MEGPLQKLLISSPYVYKTWPPQTILVSDWLISKKSSPLKPLCLINRNLVGSIYTKFRIIWQSGFRGKYF
jgi:hypothetical protein